MQQSDGGMTEVEWEGILHWKTWVLAGLDCCISTIKYALHKGRMQGFKFTSRDGLMDFRVRV